MHSHTRAHSPLHLLYYTLQRCTAIDPTLKKIKHSDNTVPSNKYFVSYTGHQCTFGGRYYNAVVFFLGKL